MASKNTQKNTQETGPKEAEPVSTWSLETEDGLVTVLHKNWRAVDPTTGQLYIPANRTTYFDRMTFVGGVGRNIPVEIAQEWRKKGFVSRAFIFPNDSQESDWEKVTGRFAVSQQDFADALADMTPEKLASILGDEKAEAFAKALRRLVNSGKEERT